MKNIMRKKEKSASDIRPWFTFQWHITDACDQRCTHCYIYGEDRQKEPETVSAADFVRILDKCLGFCDRLNMQPSFCITGGDPLLHPDFWSFAELLHQAGVSFTVMGNPFHLTAGACKKLKKLGCRQYQMSIDGLEATHDRMRKPGSYRETMEKIALLNRTGLPSAIMTTVSRTNMAEIPDVIKVMDAAGVSSYAFSRYCPTGPDKDVGITPSEYRQFLADCATVIHELLEKGSQTRYGKKDHLWTLYDYERGRFQIPEETEPGVIYGGCHCGISHLTILPNGDVYACRRVLSSRIGNALTDNLSELWAGPMNQYRDYTRFEKCASCELMPWCRGCPAVASGTQNGNFYAPDPQCWK